MHVCTQCGRCCINSCAVKCERLHPARQQLAPTLHTLLQGTCTTASAAPSALSTTPLPQVPLCDIPSSEADTCSDADTEPDASTKQEVDPSLVQLAQDLGKGSGQRYVRTMSSWVALDAPLELAMSLKMAPRRWAGVCWLTASAACGLLGCVLLSCIARQYDWCKIGSGYLAQGAQCSTGRNL